MRKFFIHQNDKRRFHTVIRKVVALITAVAVMFVSLPFVDWGAVINDIVSLRVRAVAPRHAQLTYNDLTDFAAYSIAYSTHSDEYCEDEITLALNYNLVNNIPSNYLPLGTSSHPFNGKIYIAQPYGNDMWFETDKPLFDYIADSAVINYADTDHKTEPIRIELRRKENSAITPLLANHVTQGDAQKATWKIKSALQQQSSDGGYNYLACNFAGLIGSVEANASITVQYDNSSMHGDKHSDVVSNNTVTDVGLICGTMEHDSLINLTLTGTNTSCYVTSEQGHAGGFVGKMNEGSTLNIVSTTYEPSADRHISAANGYAGGIVGYNNGGRIIFPSDSETKIRGTITGENGAGGIYGYYTNYKENNAFQDASFHLKNYDIDCTVKSVSGGGVAGVIDGKANITVDGSASGSNEITVTGDTVTDFGGICGKYQTSALTNTLSINTVTANTSASLTGTSYYGGVCGQIDGSNAAYIKAENFTHKSSSGFDGANAFGGVVGHAGSNGSMLDVGTVTIETGSGSNGQQFKGGGIVGVLNTGVLRLSGTTNLQKAPANADHDYGQLVGIRQDSLVYAVGSGNDNGWTLQRSNMDVQADDIGTWGSVIRTGTNLTAVQLESQNGANTGVVDFNTTAHTVTIAAPVTTTMSTAADFTKTALNMQLKSSDKGALKFAGSTDKSTLLGTNLSFSGTIDLSGTGNIGLMRDDYKDNINQIGQYTGTISGGQVNLAIGERYGTPSSGTGRGAIMAHRYNGLISRTGTNVKFNDMTVGGTIDVNSKLDNTYIGGFAASVENGISITNGTASETINFNAITRANDAAPSGLIVGGMIGDIHSANTQKISLNGTVSPTINLTGAIGEATAHSVGGAVGRINSKQAFQINVNTLSVGTAINTTGVSSLKNIAAAGLIGYIVDSSTTRTMKLTGLTVSGTNLANTATEKPGGLLGYSWLDTDVNFTLNNGLTVSGTNTLTTTGAKYVGGLVNTATGHWSVSEKGIKISGSTTLSGFTNSLGLLVHDGYHDKNGLYLELTHKDSYDLGTGLTIPSVARYDELVCSTGADVLANGSKGIVSITTDGDFIMNGTSCNTYQNKYNQSNLSNDKSRYYYNLTSIADKNTKSDGEKLLLWSLHKYAAANINSNFPDSFGSNALTGTFDMEHLSYYPVDVDAGMTIGDATFTFYNQKIENSESGTGNTDNGVRTTRGASQHYLMHSGVFRNVNSSVTTSGNIHFKGDIGVGSTTKTIKDENNQDVQVTTTYSGALINGTLGGSLNTASNKEIVFEGLTLSDSSKYLFINKMSTNSELTLSGVRTGGGKDFSNTDQSSAETKYGAGVTVASSLIGDVSGNGIQIIFDRMKLDSRKTAGTPADWSAQYGTTKSIFSGATFLNKFAVDNNSTGIYNFLEAEDWDGNTHNANVTYGMEIKTSVQYKDKQQKYFDQTHFVDPVTAPSSSRTEVYPFDNGNFLPYVKESTAITHDPAYMTREIKVNVVTQGLTDGCGTYNHPYEITKDYQLVEVQQTMRKDTYLTPLRLPKCNCSNDNDMTTLNGKIKDHWCQTKDTTCAEFELDGDVYKYTEDTTTYTWTKEQVSLYLASAYYLIKNDITIDDADFTGLGASPASDTTGKYAFRGVIVGAKSDGSIKITNKSGKYQTVSNENIYNTYGLITISNGCVVKDLTIEVDLPETDVYNYLAEKMMPYAYNEDFPNYGAVINKIMGGDNIIDNVSVRLAENDVFKIYTSSDHDYHATVGGYVGCIVNGGLIFRNVDDDSLQFTVRKANKAGQLQTHICNGQTITELTNEKDLAHIYVNPFVGRVINGYAIRESDHYAFSEDGATYGDGETRANAVEVTMHNTRKNYSIPDIDTTNTNKLTFSQSEGQTTYDTITVPDSQALYIMSIIAQSGSGCATGDGNNYDYNISYCGGTGRNYSGNTADNNKATHLASYSNVGTATSTTDADYVVSKLDMLNNKKAVPYIIYKYTNSYTSSNKTYYPARTLTKRTFYVNLVGGTTYYLPDCFRGIGFLGSDNYVNDNMKIFGFNGNGATIDFNTEYFTPTKSNDPYFGKNDVKLVCGMAMFNCLQQKDSNNTASAKYEQNKKYQITDFTMQGFITAHHVNKYGKDEDSSPQGQPINDYFCTAGFVSYIRNNDIKLFNISDINFKKFHINSHSYAGGFFAYMNDSSVRIYINNCNADGFKIEGVGRVGGFVGSYDSSKNSEGGIHINTGLDDDGNDSYTSVIKNTIVNNRFKTDNKSNYSAGIVASVYCSPEVSTTNQGDNALGTLILRNVTIEGGNAETNYIGNKNDPSGSSGGIMGGGTNNVKGCLIQNCIVKDIDIYGRYAGGIMGENANRGSTESVTGARIVGCKVTGTLDDNNNPQYTIKARQYAGGIYGDTRDHGEVNAKYKSISAGDSDFVEYKTDIDGVYVYGYKIFSINEKNENQSDVSQGFGAGGITGNNENDRKIQNCKVEKCVIDVGTNSSSATNTPCGGLIGRINSGHIYGYNIEVKDCDFQTHQWNNGAATNVQKAYPTATNTPVSGMKCGNVVGNGNNNIVNITAIHVENGPAPDDFNNHNADNSFIIYADYNDVSSGNDKGTAMSTLSVLPSGYSNVGEGGLKDYFPNVNVSPVVRMGTDTILTGDGAALYGKVTRDENNQPITTPTPVIDAVVNESDSNYTTPTSEVKSYIQRALRSTNVEGEPNKISTYKTEMGSLPANVDDFTVLVINSEHRDSSTELINDYIRMVTNTNYEFISKPKWSNKYEISVYPCTYNGTNYVINADGTTAGLNIELPTNENGSYGYYMSNTHADSNQSNYQFSLMDVQFYNPNTNLKEIVYHLYIPVLTKKMLLFEFQSASQSGTDHKAANFANYANTLAESLDSWYTAYLHFSYAQTELNSILESGAGLNWNGAKTVWFKYITNTVAAKLDADTQLVLCDPNHKDQYYYSRLSDHRPETDNDGEKDIISFVNFKTSLTGGTSFIPATLNDMLLAQGFRITAAQSATPEENIYNITTNPAEADVVASDGTMYKYAGANQQGYKLSVSYVDENNYVVPTKKLDENYYLAVRAKGSSVYNYSIRTPATTSGGADKPTLRRSNTDEGNVTNIIMGNLYSQTVTIGVLNNETTQREITSANHRLDVTLRSMIELSGTDSDKDYILAHLTNENIHLYQSFIIYLTAQDEDGVRNEILGTPHVTTDFTLSGNGNETTETGITPDNEVTGTYLQLKHYDVKGYLSKSGTAMITAKTFIDFDDEWKYQEEFPVQDGTEEQIGVNVSAVSNLSYNPDKLRFTNMTTLPTTPNSTYYYIKESDEASLIYNMKSEILDEYDKVGAPSFNYSQQGINPKNFIDTTQTRLPIQTAATYSATKIKRSDFMNAEKIQYTLKLYKKVDDGTEVKYNEVNDVAHYIDLTAADSVFIKIHDGVTPEFADGAKMTQTGNTLVYMANIDQSAFTRQENQRIMADINFTVITGEGFTDFANYRFVLSVDLLKSAADAYRPITETSYTYDWVVYTNAKINPNILTLNEYAG